MAEKGFTFEAILNKYYKNITLSKISFMHGMSDDFINSTLDQEKELVKETVVDTSPVFNKPVETEESHSHEDDSLGTFLDQFDKTEPQEDNRISLDQIIR